MFIIKKTEYGNVSYFCQFEWNEYGKLLARFYNDNSSGFQAIIYRNEDVAKTTMKEIQGIMNIFIPGTLEVVKL